MSTHRTRQVLLVGALAAAALLPGTAVALADPWIPEIPGVPDIGGPGANILGPGTPLPPGHGYLPPPGHLPGAEDLVPNWGHGWR